VIALLQELDEDTKIYLRHDRGNSYGTITQDDFEIEEQTGEETYEETNHYHCTGSADSITCDRKRWNNPQASRSDAASNPQGSLQQSSAGIQSLRPVLAWLPLHEAILLAGI
jgi:hypothetical protein